MNKKIVAIVSLALVAVLAIGQILTASRGFSPLENRYLKTMPQADWQTIRSGSYMDDLETYLADHIPGRDQWILLRNTLLRLEGRKQIGSVCFAEEDRLIQVQDVSLEQLQKNMESLNRWAAGLPEQVQVDFLLAPNASWIYEDQLPKHIQSYSPKEAIALVEGELSKRFRLTLPYDTLMQHRDEAIYFKSDHHWTMRGAAYAWLALQNCMEIAAPDPFSYDSMIMGQNFKGSIYSQAPVYGYNGEPFEVLQTPGLEASWQTESESGKVLMTQRFSEKDQYTAFLGGNYGLARVSNENALSKEKILILKDSYANILIPFLAEYYEEILMVDLRFYREDIDQLLTEEGIHQVICIYNLDFLHSNSPDLQKNIYLYLI